MTEFGNAYQCNHLDSVTNLCAALRATLYSWASVIALKQSGSVTARKTSFLSRTVTSSNHLPSSVSVYTRTVTGV